MAFTKMNEEFINISVLIWDFDGTLYKLIPELFNEILESEYQVILHHTGWTREKTIEEFNKIYKIKTPSGTKTTAILSGIPITQAAIEVEWYKDRTKYLKLDGRLVHLFKQLNSYTHYMLVNGTQDKIRKASQALGLADNIFIEIVTSEIVGENKPSEKGFQYILEKTGLSPDQHLMIGDRVDVDLVPAKKLGMKTCLVWSEEKSEVPDVVLKTVYDIEKLLL